MQIDLPDVLAEVRAAFEVYERALVENDVATLDRLFLHAPTTIRYGGAENLYGYEDIAAFRAARSPVGLARTLERTVITAYGRDCAVASTLFRRERLFGKIGRQMQIWVRMPEGWRVAAAHVSIIEDPAASDARHGAEDERRGTVRHKTLKSIRIILPGGMSTIDCVIRNRSETGLLIRLNGPVAMPPEFEVLVDNARRSVRVAWKRGLDLGVAYV